MQRPWSDGAHAHAERPGELSLSPRREGARLFVTHPDPLETLLGANRIGDRVQRIPHHAPD
jgi:hypothetical protein